jgi:tetratricopeptide (TPR) repeat protein
VRGSLVFCGAVLALSSLLTARAEVPLQSEYLDIYLKMNDAAKLEINGDDRGALAEFEDCYTRLYRIHVNNPHWENVLVTNRLGDLHAHIVALETKLAPPPAAKAPVANAPVIAPPTPAPESAQARLLTLQAAVKASPNEASACFNLGTAYFQLDQNDTAIDTLQRGLELEPANIYAHNYLGCAFLRKGRIESAAKEFQKAIALEETFAEPHYNLAMLYATEDPPALNSARAQYKRAIELGMVPDPHLQKVLRAGSK